jgi:pyrroline-5-carboxylate reductase
MREIGRLAIIGAGAMGSAFAEGVISAKTVAPSDVIMADVDRARLNDLVSRLGVNTTSDNAAAVESADVILLAVKPALVKDVLSGVSDLLSKDKLIVSIAAGVRIESIEAAVPAGTPVIRAMPNTACRIGLGAIGFSRGTTVLDKHVEVAAIIFNSTGIAVEVPEKLLNAVTGLSGSGPAYVYLIIEALSDAGVRVGLPRDVSLRLAAQTVLGAAKMVTDSGDHPARLKDQVTSPGGTTIAGIDVLEREGVRSALIEAVKAATRRSEELG